MRTDDDVSESAKEVIDSNTESNHECIVLNDNNDNTHSVGPSLDDDQDNSSLLSSQSSVHEKKDKKYCAYRIRKLRKLVDKCRERKIKFPKVFCDISDRLAKKPSTVTSDELDKLNVECLQSLDSGDDESSDTSVDSNENVPPHKKQKVHMELLTPSPRSFDKMNPYNQAWMLGPRFQGFQQQFGSLPHYVHASHRQMVTQPSVHFFPHQSRHNLHFHAQLLPSGQTFQGGFNQNYIPSGQHSNYNPDSNLVHVAAPQLSRGMTRMGQIGQSVQHEQFAGNSAGAGSFQQIGESVGQEQFQASSAGAGSLQQFCESVGQEQFHASSAGVGSFQPSSSLQQMDQSVAQEHISGSSAGSETDHGENQSSFDNIQQNSPRLSSVASTPTPSEDIATPEMTSTPTPNDHPVKPIVSRFIYFFFSYSTTSI